MKEQSSVGRSAVVIKFFPTKSCNQLTDIITANKINYISWSFCPAVDLALDLVLCCKVCYSEKKILSCVGLQIFNIFNAANSLYQTLIIHFLKRIL